MRLSRILLTGDSFRTTAGEQGQLANVLWVERTLGGLLHRLTGIQPQIALPLAAADGPSFLELQHARMGLEGWAQTFDAPPTEELVDALKQSCAGALVVSFEAPPILSEALGQAGIPWIDVGVSPLRFLPDWALHLRASAHFDLGEVAAFALSQKDIATATDHVRDWYAPADIHEPTLTFFAQTENDRTLIRRDPTEDHCFCGPDEALAAVEQLVGSKRLLVKPHPWQPETSVVKALVEQAGATIVEDNSYALLANPNVEVVTLSSSIGREARAFGRPTTVVNPWVQDWAYSGMDILRHSQSPTLWGDLLASAGIAVSRDAEGTIWAPNRLRGEFGGQGLDLEVWS